MSSVQSFVINYLDAARIMNLATIGSRGIWCSTVYFAVDNLHTIYWLSEPHARHSRDIDQAVKQLPPEVEADERGASVAATIVIPQEYRQPWQGLQVEGVASMVSPQETESLFQSYAERFTAHTVIEDMRAGRDSRRLYKLKPKAFVLYDDKFFHGDAYQEWRLDGLAVAPLSDEEQAIVDGQPSQEQEHLAIDDMLGAGATRDNDGMADATEGGQETMRRNPTGPQTPPIIDPETPRNPF